ncbi:MAG: hypothetical protein V9E94_14505 [Microthrixaceae bacterium]
MLTPLAVDPGHPFPYISSLSLNLGVIVRDPTTDLRRFARVKVPSLLPRFVVMPDGERFVPLEQVIARPPRPAVPRHGGDRPRRVPRRPATPISPSRTRRPTISWQRSRWSCAAAASARPCDSRSRTTSPPRRSS